MNRYQLDVLAFHRAFGHSAPDRPTLAEYPFRARADFILEEALEYTEASGYKIRFGTDRDGDETLRTSSTPQNAPDWVKMIDASFDLIYFALGNLVSMGLDLDPFWDEGHRSNMSKRQPDGTVRKREDGKVLKPDGWRPPDFGRVLAEQSIAAKSASAETAPPCDHCDDSAVCVVYEDSPDGMTPSPRCAAHGPTENGRRIAVDPPAVASAGEPTPKPCGLSDVRVVGPPNSDPVPPGFVPLATDTQFDVIQQTVTITVDGMISPTLSEPLDGADVVPIEHMRNVLTTLHAREQQIMKLCDLVGVLAEEELEGRIAELLAIANAPAPPCSAAPRRSRCAEDEADGL